MYNLKQGEVAIIKDNDKIKIYYCPGFMSGNDKITAVKNIETQYGNNLNYQIIKVPEGYPVPSIPQKLDTFIPVKTTAKKIAKENIYTIKCDSKEEIYNILINADNIVKKDVEKIILKEIFRKIPIHSRYRLIWQYKEGYEIIDDPKQTDEIINLFTKAFKNELNEQLEINKFNKEIDKYNELADLEASWNTEFTGKNTKK